MDHWMTDTKLPGRFSSGEVVPEVDKAFSL